LNTTPPPNCRTLKFQTLANLQTRVSDNGWSRLVLDFGTSGKTPLCATTTRFPRTSNCRTTWGIQWSAFSQMIYGVDSLWDFRASGILPPFVKILKIVEATKSEGLEGLTVHAPFPDLMTVKDLPSPEQIQRPKSKLCGPKTTGYCGFFPLLDFSNR
jgi:hypothetical protein